MHTTRIAASGYLEFPVVQELFIQKRNIAHVSMDEIFIPAKEMIFLSCKYALYNPFSFGKNMVAKKA